LLQNNFDFPLLWWFCYLTNKFNTDDDDDDGARGAVERAVEPIYKLFSILMSSVMPSYISLTAWNSVKPMRRLLEMS